MAEAQGVEEDRDLVAGTLQYLAGWLVAFPDDVRVEKTLGERGPLYRLSVHPDDLGRVIGRGGRVARAIRQVARAAAARSGVFVSVEING